MHAGWSTDDQYAATEEVRRRCRRCGGKTLSSEFDGEHENCVPEVDPARQREAIRRLHKDTAKLLRRAGFPEEAAYHDLMAEGR